MSRPKPPRIATALLSVFIPGGDREFVLGDLEEQYAERCRRANAAGRARDQSKAWAWYWGQALRSSWCGALARLRGGVPRRGAAGWVDGALLDLRQALRGYRRSPGFTVVAVATLAIGLGTVTAIFTFVNAFFLRPLPYDHAEELVMIWERPPPGERFGDDGTMTVNPLNYLDWVGEAGSFSAMVAFNLDMAILTGETSPERVTASVVTPGFFETLGVRPSMGTLFSPRHGEPGQENVALLSHDLWQRRYGGDPDIVGRTITVDDEPTTVLGVIPPNYHHPDPGAKWLHPELWRPIALDLTTQTRRGRWMRVLARLGPGVTLRQAQAEMTGIANGLSEAYPESNQDWGATVVSLEDQQFSSARPAVLILLGVGGLVLLIVCVNLANLFLARSHGRSREFAVRSALGSGRGRLASQLFLEGLLASGAGGALGILVTYASSRVLQGLQARHFPSVAEVGVDTRVVLFALLLSSLTAVLFSMIPTLGLLRAELRSALTEGSAGAGTRARTIRAREWLVAGQIGLTAVLLFGAVLLTRSFVELVRVPPGFATQRTLTFSVELPPGTDQDPRVAGDFFEQLRRRLGSLPGAREATVASDLPFTIWNNYKNFRPLEMDPETEEAPSIESRTVAANYFDVMGIPLLSGRTFSSEDRFDGPLAFVVNRQLAELLWPGENPLGRQAEISLRREPATGTVVGVVADILDDGPRGEHEPRFYLSYDQDPKGWGSIILTSSVEAMSLVPAARRAVEELNDRVPVTDVITMEALVRESTSTERVLSGLAVAFGFLTLLLAAVGIYGVMAYSVSERKREIGIRTALGAGRSEVRGLVMLRAFRMSLLGTFGGIVLALVLGRVLASVLFGVTPRDPLSFLITFAVLGGVALVAAWIPARQASLVDPMVAIRAE